MIFMVALTCEPGLITPGIHVQSRPDGIYGIFESSLKIVVALNEETLDSFSARICFAPDSGLLVVGRV
jgi:hypothetical protein